MTKLSLLSRGSRIAFALVLVFGIMLATVDNAHSQRPTIPYLSLTGVDGSYDDNWYPDGRIWLPQSANGPREFLLPIFMDNRWATYPETADRYVADPIYSFQFKVLYDSSALRAIGVQKFHPITKEYYDAYDDRRFFEWYEPLAQDFNISWYDDRDFSYRLYLNPLTPRQDYEKGRGITISGTSSQPLPNTDLDNREWKVLLYIKFRVVPKVGGQMGTAQNTPIIISNDTIRYNDLIVTKVAPFTHMRDYDPQVAIQYPDPNIETGIEGVRNDDKDEIWPIEPTLPGVIYLRLMGSLPDFDFELLRGIGSQPAIEKLSTELWYVVDPITIDSADTYDLFRPIGQRIVQVLNKTISSRLNHIEIESDSPWLQFRTVDFGSNFMVPNPIPLPTTYGKIDYIDNNILGTEKDPRAEETVDDGEVHLEIIFDPSALNLGDDEGDPEKTGIYVGYITFKSPYALINPIRMRVTCIYFRNPVEGDFRTASDPGIELFIKNSNPVIERSQLIFGTGHRASDGVDSLFGEYAYEYPIGGFGARFIPKDKDGNDMTLFGLGDFNSNDEMPRSDSRDIRSNTDTTESIKYLVRFDADGDENYPVILEWDIRDFIEGSQLFIRDTMNGALFPSVNMRNATGQGPTKRSFTIQDPRITSFVIEYTLPRVIDYVDEYGVPIIKPGWNLLSLPVKPTNSTWDVFYPNAINRPFYFSQNQYQDENVLREGIGYFVKYSTTVDIQFAGTFISKISLLTGNSPLLYPGDAGMDGGWNTVGSCSGPVNVEDIGFDNDGNERPSRDYVQRHGVYGYFTNEGYKEVSVMEPGLGYWLKVDEHGYLNIEASRGKVASSFNNGKADVLAASAKVMIRDNDQNVGTVYMSTDRDVQLNYFELPPAMRNMFDIRFASNGNLENSNTSIINLSGVTYPLSISIDNADADYTFYDNISGKELGTIRKGSNDIIEIIEETSNNIRVNRNVEDQEGSFGISSYPNPATDATSTISFSIAENSYVTVKIYNEIGIEVLTLVDEFRTSGEYSEPLFTNLLPASGSYICKLTAGNSTKITRIVVVK